MNKDAKRLFELWGTLLERTGGVGPEHEQWLAFMAANGLVNTPFGKMTAEEAIRSERVMKEFLSQDEREDHDV